MSQKNTVALQWSGRAHPNRSQRALYGGRQINFGNHISFSHHTTRRTWKPNVVTKHLWSDLLNRQVELRVTTFALRWIDQEGGLDNYLLNTSDKKLASLYGMKLKKQLQDIYLLKFGVPHRPDYRQVQYASIRKQYEAIGSKQRDEVRVGGGGGQLAVASQAKETPQSV
eukprot:TRINITY_DN3714_c0_g1_i3.p1 TRINITY_DN3714_c0_g1~~TRINITY_DN3714_c0_g1_i3.p1  ORF type:complete len:169 (+),score=27.52 TRINITY_DN3714_c0_g1_i3:36-542(+)